MTPEDILKSYAERNFQLVFWPGTGDAKGPREKDWPKHPKPITEWRVGMRCGIITGTEIAQGRFLHDIDIDWAPGSVIAQVLLPPTGFVFGRESKRVSHCFYTTNESLKTMRFEDTDKTVLLEIRGVKSDGHLGFQTMAPPSEWSKEGKREQLVLVRNDMPAHLDVQVLRARGTLAAIGMILAKRFGHNGFGHDIRLAWAGFLLRANIAIEDLVAMGEAISQVCNNREVADVRRVLESTAASLAVDSKKVKGGPALARIVGKDVVDRINEWLGREADFVRDQRGNIAPKHAGNIRRAVELLGHELTHNQFSDKMLIDGVTMEDRQVNSLLLKIEHEYRFQPPESYFRMVVEDMAWKNGFHPVKDYLEPLVWDGVPRIDTWLIDYADAADTEYVRAVSSIFMIAAVRRVMQPGAKYDEMLILEGVQGVGKSSATQALCPDPTWFVDDIPLNLRAQQLIEATLGKWIVEASDLAGKRKTEIEHLKAMLSRQVDGPARMAYAHMPVERPRHFVLIGTTNSEVYLNDPTGARRFWPITVGKRFNVEKIIENRDQMWAEAKMREARGDSIRLPEALWPAAAIEQEKRREMDPWEIIIREDLAQILPDSAGIRRCSTAALWQAVGVPPERQDRGGQLRISEIMQRLGFKRCTVRENGIEKTGYKQVNDVLDRPMPGSDEAEETLGSAGSSADVPF